MDFEDRAQRGPYFGLFLQILVCPELTACKENVPQFANHTKRLSLHGPDTAKRPIGVIDTISSISVIDTISCQALFLAVR